MSEVDAKMMPHEFSAELLSLLERSELRLLSWGFYEPAFTADEAQQILLASKEAELVAAWAALEAQGWTFSVLLDEMAAGGVLYRADAAGAAYRTRLAESVRLFAHLRQMFNDGDWATGANLVSDLKLHVARRKYPHRNQQPEDCLVDLRPLFKRAKIQEDAFNALSRGAAGNAIPFASFQRTAFAYVLREYAAPRTAGTVISAGTGAGKTKAFYVPAFLGAIAELDAAPFTKIIAIYPRNVLLADQLREALSEAAKLAPVLAQHKLRPLRFGALLGPTPEMNWFTADRDGKFKATKRQWRRVQSGWVVPFLNSPTDGKSEMVWREQDRLQGRTNLHFADRPDHEAVPHGWLALTREQIRTHPPDVLFVSLEMLNREMGNPEYSRAFGLDPKHPPVRMLLLDEVHAHEGPAGAQAAWVLRRWRFWSGARPLHVVGLSATLRDAPKHLSAVAQLPVRAVREIQPQESEMLSESAEYSLCLKADPASRASLLSTTIQSAMLLSRLLTPANRLASAADATVRADTLFGRKVFAFTDNLDVVNRWFSDIHDAESVRRLAQYRLHPAQRTPPPVMMPTPLEIQNRDRAGQIWELPRLLGHDLKMAKRTARCSSQDPGADAAADVIVATSALEVGFDDASVGAMLHHKRPGSMSSYIQRRGRAGRSRGSRPWTVLVLSDYGADRWAFQNAERFFEPQIDAIRLPIRNPYVLRIQAAYFLLDWLGRRIARGGPFYYLSGPWDSAARQEAITLLRDLLGGGQLYQEFRGELRRLIAAGFVDSAAAAAIDAEVDDILWHEPRPLLRQVIPTLLRKLEAAWAFADPARKGRREDEDVVRPIPRYVPKATFSELNIAEVRIDLDSPILDDEEGVYLPVAHALFETCPGRVSKRFAPGEVEHGFWNTFSVQLLGQVPSAAANEVYPEALHVASVGAVNVFQAIAAQVIHRPKDVSDSASSSWDWQSAFRTEGAGMNLGAFGSPRWRDVIVSARAFVHRDRATVRVIRYAQSCRYEIAVAKQGVTRGRLRIERQTSPDAPPIAEAVGFDLAADGLRLELSAKHLQQIPALMPAELARHRAEFFLQRIRTSGDLEGFVNYFSGEWVWQLSMAMLAATAARNSISLQEAQQRLTNRSAAARAVLDQIFGGGAAPADAGDNQPADADHQPHVRADAKLKANLIALWSQPLFVVAMTELERTLWDPPAAEFQNYLRRRYVSTLAQAFRAAAVAPLRDLAEDDLSVDVDWPANGSAAIFLTETVAGGVGQIEAILAHLHSNPTYLQDALAHSLGWCRANEISRQLRAATAEVVEHPHAPLAQAFATVRESSGFQSQEQSRQQLHAAIAEAGLLATRDALVSVAVRLVGPGTSAQTDQTTLELNRAWDALEEQLQIQLDPRVFAFLAVQLPNLRPLVEALAAPVAGEIEGPRLLALAQRVLLMPCGDSCRECLDNPVRFGGLIKPSRSLALRWLNWSDTVVHAGDADLTQRVLAALAKNSQVRLVADDDQLAALPALLADLLSHSVERELTVSPIRIARIDSENSGGETKWRVLLQLAEDADA